jgi:hypothetical protein
MSFKQLTGESIAEAWEHYHLIVADFLVARMEDWNVTQGFYYGRGYGSSSANLHHPGEALLEVS